MAFRGRGAAQDFCAMTAVVRLLILLVALVGQVEGAGTSIFKLGSEIDKKHWDVMGMYFIVFGITILFELVVHRLHHTVVSDSGKAIVHHITQEIMILGGIAAVLVVFENLGGTKLINAALFHYVHFVIFLMAIIFIVLVSSLFVTIDKAWSAWSRFEHRLDEIESDPSLDYESKTAFLHQYVKSTNHGQRMLACLIFFKHNLPGPLADVGFSRYMKKMQRKFMLAFLDLHRVTWALLAVLCSVAAVVTFITLKVSDNELATVGLWVLFVGFGPLLVLAITFFKIRNEYRRFTSEVLHMRKENRSRPKMPQVSLFWRNNSRFTVMLMQIMLLYQVFFLATAAVNFAYRLALIKPLGPLFIVICFIPSLIVFFVMIPLVLPPFTILASLGDLLDHDTMLKMKVQDKASGRYRRLERRDGEITAPPLYLSTKETVLHNFSNLQRERVELTLNFSGKCEECKERVASEVCRVCGYLCNDCSFNYHKLKQFAAHKRKHLHSASQAEKDGVMGLDFKKHQAAADAAAGGPVGGAGRPGLVPVGSEPGIAFKTRNPYLAALHAQSPVMSDGIAAADPLTRNAALNDPTLSRLVGVYMQLGMDDVHGSSPSAHSPVDSGFSSPIYNPTRPSRGFINDYVNTGIAGSTEAAALLPTTASANGSGGGGGGGGGQTPLLPPPPPPPPGAQQRRIAGRGAGAAPGGGALSPQSQQHPRDTHILRASLRGLQPDSSGSGSGASGRTRLRTGGGSQSSSGTLDNGSVGSAPRGVAPVYGGPKRGGVGGVGRGSSGGGSSSEGSLLPPPPPPKSGGYTQLSDDV